MSEVLLIEHSVPVVGRHLVANASKVRNALICRVNTVSLLA